MWGLIPWKKEHSGKPSLSTLPPLEGEFSRFRDEFDSLLGRMFSRFPSLTEDVWDGLWGLDLDVEEAEDHYLVRIPAPGFEVEDFDVHISGSQLVIKAERQQEQKRTNGSSVRYGRLHRTLPLMESVDADQVQCRYHSGVLELKIPKGKETQRKKIAVQTM